MYNILMSGQLYSVAETLEEAVRLVQQLESGMNRLLEHSPFTITLAEEN